MKTKADKSESHVTGWVRCMDQLDTHRANAEVVAGLLEGCALECMDPDLIKGAGRIIRRELKEMWAWLRKLEQELRK